LVSKQKGIKHISLRSLSSLIKQLGRTFRSDI